MTRRLLLAILCAALMATTTVRGVPGDVDDDGVLDELDNCPRRFNPSQLDSDGDGVGDICDGDEVVTLEVGGAAMREIGRSSLGRHASDLRGLALGDLNGDAFLDLADIAGAFGFGAGGGLFVSTLPLVLPGDPTVHDLTFARGMDGITRLFTGLDAGIGVVGLDQNGDPQASVIAGPATTLIDTNGNGILYTLTPGSSTTAFRAYRIQANGVLELLATVGVAGVASSLDVTTDLNGDTLVLVGSFVQPDTALTQVYRHAAANQGVLTRVHFNSTSSAQPPQAAFVNDNDDGSADSVTGADTTLSVYQWDGGSYSPVGDSIDAGSTVLQIAGGNFAGGGGFCVGMETELGCFLRQLAGGYMLVSGPAVGSLAVGDVNNDGADEVVGRRITGPDVLVLEPDNISLDAGEQLFEATINREPASATWSTTGGIGTLSSTTGSSVILTAATPPPGTTITGQIVVQFGELQDTADVTIFAPVLAVEPSDPTLGAGATQIFTFTINGQPVSVQWSTTGGIGTVSPDSGPSTTLTAGSNSATGQVVASRGGVVVGTARVTVVASTSDLVYEDPLGATDEILLFEPSPAEGTRIVANQIEIRGIDRLLAELVGNPSPIAQWLRGVLNDARARAVARLDALVPASVRYRIRGDGDDAVPATLRSLDPNNDLLRQYDLDLTPGGSVVSMPFVAVRAGGRILDGRFGDLLFVGARIGGTLVTHADGYGDALAPVRGR